MEFVKHNHPLILDENFHGDEKDACYICGQQLFSTLKYSVYRCSSISDGGIADDDVDCVNLFVHKSCADLPLEMTNYFRHPQHPITLVRLKSKPYQHPDHCSICSRRLRHTIVYSCESCDLTVCLKCVTSPTVYHPSHKEHALALVQREATFNCDACGWESTDLSSCKCSTCPFWIHTSCAILSVSQKFQFHIHPLLVAYSFPQHYLKFKHRCIICKRLIKPTLWLYHCAGCRVFFHIDCAKLNPKTTIRPSDVFGDIVHLPSRDESSVTLLRQLLIHQTMINQGEADALTWSFSPISTITTAEAKAGPDKEVIHHWSHDQHPLNLRNKCSAPKKLQSMTLKDSTDYEDDTVNIVCDGCTNPINSSTAPYYECHPCKYFLHSYCAELPKQMQPYTLPFEVKPSRNISYQILFSEFASSNLFKCVGCNHLKSGMHIATDDGYYKLDIGCAMLPGRIKHEAHEHPLYQAISCWNYYQEDNSCSACGLLLSERELYFRCNINNCHYSLHTQCALRPHKLKHRWDSDHPLTLITPENIIEDHPHDFNCEHCSDDIDTNYWFYHCHLCDLSCHMSCINEFYRYSGINFRASNIQLHQKLHQHPLTPAINKTKDCCGICHRQLFHSPALQCPTCNFIICLSCFDADKQTDKPEYILPKARSREDEMYTALLASTLKGMKSLYR